MPKGIKKNRKSPALGTIFKRNFKGTIYTLTVVEENGVLRYEMGGQIYDSPSGAAQSLVKNRYAVNGWVFWGMKNY